MKIKKTVMDLENSGVFNEETGEIYESNRKGRITIEEFLEEEELDSSKHDFMEDVTFIRSFRGNGILMNEYLTNAEIAVVMFLNDFICYDDCVLRKNGNKLGDALTVSELSEMYGLKYDSFRKIIASLKNKQVVAIHNCGEVPVNTAKSDDKFNKIKWITVNPYLFCRGIKVDDFIRDYFAESMWAKVPRQKTRTKKTVYM